MKRSFFIYLLILSPFVSYSQQEMPKYMSHDTSLYQYPPLLILKMASSNIKLNMVKMSELNPNDIDSLTILKDTTAVKMYGDEARFGVIIIKMKKQIIITDTDAGTNSLNDLQINNRALKSYKLPVYIDSVYVNRPENVNKLLIKIKSVTISTEAITGIKFINILTYRNSVNIQNGNKTEKHGNSETPIMIR